MLKKGLIFQHFPQNIGVNCLFLYHILLDKQSEKRWVLDFRQKDVVMKDESLKDFRIAPIFVFLSSSLTELVELI